MEADKTNNFTVYPWRYVIILSFVAAGCANALVLLTWSPISDKANVYWNDIGLTSINLLAVAFQISYIPGTALALYISKYYGLKAILVSGGCLTTFGCLVRWIGAYVYERSSYDVSPTSSYAIVLLGTFFVALSQPFYLNLPAKIASSWFPVKERDFATTICSLSNPLGSALGSLLSPLFVSGGDDDNASVNGVSNLLLLQLVVAIVAWIFIIFMFSSEPPTPPSNTESKKMTEVVKRRRNAWKDAEQLIVNPEYLKLFLSFSIALGNLNALAALLGQLPGGYSNGEFGITGFALILCGFCGAFMTGMVLEKTKAYRPTLKIAWVAATIGWILFVSSCRVGNAGFFISSAALLGFCLLPVIPATIMNAVECAYPVMEDLSVGMLYVGANTLAVMMTFLGQIILATPEDSAGEVPFYPYMIWSAGSMLVGLIPVLLYNGKYHRLDQDLQTLLIEGEDNQLSDAKRAISSSDVERS